MLSTRTDGDGFSLTVAEPHQAIPALLDYLEERQHPLIRLTTRNASLEDVFVALDRSAFARRRDRAHQTRRQPAPSALGTTLSTPPPRTRNMPRPHPLRQLYLSRLREFYRQPARIFWVYGFPTLLAICLGFAFKNPPPQVFQVDVMETPFSAPVERILKAYAVHTDQDSPPSVAESRNPPVFGPRLLLKTGDRKQVMRRLYTGKTPLVVEPTSTGAIVYHYDPSRPDSGTVRAAIDNILQEKSGRTNPVATSDDTQVEPGSRYIDFLIPGLIGVNTMGGGLWGIGFLIVNFRIGKLLKCFVATPMPRKDFLLALLGRANDVPDPRPYRLAARRHVDVRGADSRQPVPGRRFWTC